MRLLITGICGFAGSTIARELLAHQPGLTIIGLDSLIRRGSETNVEPLRALGIDVRIGDIRDRATIEALPAVDWIIDCAANPSVLAGVDGRTSSQDLLDHNLAGTIHLLEHCRRHGAGFILLSTSRVYSIEPLADLQVTVDDRAYTPILPPSAASDLPSSFNFHHSALNIVASDCLSTSGLRENFPTDPPISLYGASKKCSELLAHEYSSTFGFPAWINRCGVLAGAGQFGKADQGIFSYWIHSWAQKKPLKYIGFDGHGHQVRDCLHPRDLVPLLAKQMYTTHLGASSLPSAAPCPGAAKNPLPSSSIGGSYSPSSPILNLSGGIASAMSLRQLSDWCADKFGPHHVESDLTPRPFDIPWIVLDSSAAKAAWDWTPLTPRDKILEEIADHAKKNPKWLDMVT
jgi:CDP-paratose 2-epimerase